MKALSSPVSAFVREGVATSSMFGGFLWPFNIMEYSSHMLSQWIVFHRWSFCFNVVCFVDFIFKAEFYFMVKPWYESNYIFLSSPGKPVTANEFRPSKVIHESHFRINACFNNSSRWWYKERGLYSSPVWHTCSLLVSNTRLKLFQCLQCTTNVHPTILPKVENIFLILLL